MIMQRILTEHINLKKEHYKLIMIKEWLPNKEIGQTKTIRSLRSTKEKEQASLANKEKITTMSLLNNYKI